jgi:hypothetical protein
MTAPSKKTLDLVSQLLEEIASLSARTDRHCFYAFGEFTEGILEPEQVTLELDSLRDVINRLGWLADLANAKLNDGESIRGDAEQWLLSPMYNQTREQEENHAK